MIAPRIIDRAVVIRWGGLCYSVTQTLAVADVRHSVSFLNFSHLAYSKGLTGNNSQTPVIFSGTIRFAIDPWSYCQSDAELWAVLQAVEMDGFVKSFPGQLDGRLDENASSLSVGERQLLCVARALLRKSKIVLLDESTASVDAHSDVVVQRAVEEGFRGATIFVIAHRLHTIVQSDLIVVMEQGRLKEFGSPSQLLQMRDGSFKKMWDLENRKQQEPT